MPRHPWNAIIQKVKKYFYRPWLMSSLSLLTELPIPRHPWNAIIQQVKKYLYRPLSLSLLTELPIPRHPWNAIILKVIELPTQAKVNVVMISYETPSPTKFCNGSFWSWHRMPQSKSSMKEYDFMWPIDVKLGKTRGKCRNLSAYCTVLCISK